LLEWGVPRGIRLELLARRRILGGGAGQKQSNGLWRKKCKFLNKKSERVGRGRFRFARGGSIGFLRTAPR